MKNKYKKFLSEPTEAIFRKIDQFDFIQNFTLVGGSGLSYYLNHRLSEDLDFFSWDSSLNKNEIDKFLRSINENHNLTILNQSPSEIDLLIDNIKITFFANDWLELKLNRQKILKNTFIASI